MNRKTLSVINQRDVVSGANAMAVLGLAYYTYKQNNELTKKVEFLQEELTKTRIAMNENNKRANIAFTRLNQRVDDTVRVVSTKSHDDVPKIVEIEDNKDDIGSALNALMNRK